MLVNGNVTITSTPTKIAQAPIGGPATVYLSFVYGSACHLGDSNVTLDTGLDFQNRGMVMSIALGRNDTLYGVCAPDQIVKLGWVLSA